MIAEAAVTAQVVNVVERLAGSELVVDADLGSTSIEVLDVEGGFDADGGDLKIGAEVIAYTIPEDSEGEVDLTAPLGADYPAGTPVYVDPPSRERWASVFEPGAEEPLPVRVPHALYDHLALGLRQDEAEVVEADPVAGDLVVTDVLGREPLIDGSFLEATTVPHPHDGHPPASSPVPSVTPGVRSLFVGWTPIANADPVAYELHISVADDFAPDEDSYLGDVEGSLAAVYNLPDLSPLMPGTLYYVKIVARDADGSAAASPQASGQPLFLPSDEVTTDGAPPPASPTPTVVGGPTFLSARWDPLANNDPVTYEVHVSTTSGFAPNPGTKFVETPASSVIVNRTAGGTALAYGTTYYVKIVARDADGAAAAGAQGSAQMVKITPVDATTDGSPPASSPAVTVVGGDSFLSAKWPLVANADPVTYEVHVSTASGFAPDATTKYGETPAGSMIVKTTAAGGALNFGVLYYVRIVAKDADGAAAAGAQGSGQLAKLPSSGQTTDAAAPASSPTPTVTGGPTFLAARWSAVANNDPVTYEVHVSTASGFAPGAGTKFGETSATSIIVDRAVDGSALAPATTYYVKLIAKDADGSAAAGAQGSAQLVALPSSSQTTDAAAPASSPAPAVQGGIGILAVKWTPLANNDPVTYEVHLSTASGFAPDVTTKVGETAAGSFVIRQDAAGSALAYGTDYYVKIVARDADGTAAASAQGSGRMVQGVATRRNLVTNPSFEVDTAGWATSGGGIIGGSVLTRDTTEFNVGVASGKVVTPGASNSEGIKIPVAGLTIGQSYGVRVMAKGASGLIQVLFGNNANRSLDGTWQAITVSHTATTTSRDLIIRTVGAQAITFYVDAVIVEQGTAAGSYFDGSTGPDTAWEGTPNASPSRQAYDVRANSITAANIAALAITETELATSAVTTAKIAADAVTAGEIAASAVGNSELAAGAVTAAKITAGTITTAQIAAGTITAANVAALALTSGVIAAGAITTPKIAAGAVTASEIAANTITAAKILAGTITGDRIAADTLTANEIAAGAITASELAANSVTAAKILAGTITGDRIAAATITGGNLVADTITATQIAAGAVSTGELAAGAVTAAKIAADTITASEIAASAIGTAELAAGAVTATKIAADTITANEIAASAITSSELAASSVVAGKVAALSITAAEIAASTITGAKIAANTITATQIAADTITATQIAASAITSSELATAAVIAGKVAADAIDAGALQANSVVSTKILAGAVTTDKLVANAITADKLAAVLTISSTFQTAGSGQRVVFDTSGIRGYKPDGVSLAVSIPTVGNPFFDGILRTTDLAVSGASTATSAAGWETGGAKFTGGGTALTPPRFAKLAEAGGASYVYVGDDAGTSQPWLRQVQLVADGAVLKWGRSDSPGNSTGVLTYSGYIEIPAGIFVSSALGISYFGGQVRSRVGLGNDVGGDAPLVALRNYTGSGTAMGIKLYDSGGTARGSWAGDATGFGNIDPSGANWALRHETNGTFNAIFSGGVFAKGGSPNPAGGAGTFMEYASGFGYLFAYDFTAATYQPLIFGGSSIQMQPNLAGSKLTANATGLGFFGATPIGQPTITGSRGGNAALASLLAFLNALGLIVNGTTP